MNPTLIVLTELAGNSAPHVSELQVFLLTHMPYVVPFIWTVWCIVLGLTLVYVYTHGDRNAKP